MKKFILFSLLLLSICSCSRKEAYLFTYFKGQEDGLRLACSYDGLNWSDFPDSVFLKPEVGSKLMRDPSVAEGPDGTYHLVWTTGWSDNCIGYASTRDFIHWSPQQRLDVMAGYPLNKNTWAPEITYNEADGYFYIYWASRTNEEGADFRIYFIRTKDFKEYSPTSLFYYTGFSLIDATLLKDKSGKGWFFFLKDGSGYPTTDKYIRYVKENGPLEDGISGELSEPVTGDFWAEGPTAFYVKDTIYVYFDRYKDKRFGAVKSTDGGKNWTDISDMVHLPDKIRHGTIITVPEKIIERLKSR